MWLFLSRRLRLWFLLAVGLPVLARLAAVAADTLERRSGSATTVSKVLRKGSRWAQRKARKDSTGIAAKVTRLIPGDEPAAPVAPATKRRWRR